MTYAELICLFYQAGYQRVERDDRLLDVLPSETREHGVELWEKWDKEEVRLVSASQPFEEKKLKLYYISRPNLEGILQNNKVGKLSDYSCVAQGDNISSQL